MTDKEKLDVKNASTANELQIAREALAKATAQAEAYEKQLAAVGKKVIPPNMERFSIGGKEFKIRLPRVRVDESVFGFDIIKSDDFIKLSKSTTEANAAKAAKVLAKWQKEKVAFIIPV